LAREPVKVIIRLAGQAPSRRRPLSSNVRPHDHLQMTNATVSTYLGWITPSVGDPTYSLLRAHLLFERLIDASLERSLPHPTALSDARLSFAQKLAIARAASAQVPAAHWTWQAVSRLNKIRNLLAHSPNDAVAKEIASYVEFCNKHSDVKLPEPDRTVKVGTPAHSAGIVYTAADMVTLGLYLALASRLGFDVAKLVAAAKEGAA